MSRDFMKMVALSLTSLLLLVAAALVNSGGLDGRDPAVDPPIRP